MEKKDIKIQLEELDIDQSIIEDITSKINNNEKLTLTADQIKILQETDLKNNIIKEQNWRKRASIAARILSLNLE